LNSREEKFVKMRVRAIAFIVFADLYRDADAFGAFRNPRLAHEYAPQSFTTLYNDASSLMEKDPTKENMKEILFNDIDDTTTKIQNVRDSLGFRNDGKYWFFKTAMSVYQEGADLVNGVPVKRDATKPLVSEEDTAKRRAKAVEELVNINDVERGRRLDLGNTLLIVSAIYAAYISLAVDQGDFFGHLVRLSVFPFYSSGYGLRASGKAGL